MNKNRSASTTGFLKLRIVLAILFCFASVGLVVSALKVHSPVAERKNADRDDRLPTIPVPGEPGGDEAENLGRLEQFWNDRLTYPTGKFNPAWLRDAVAQHDKMESRIPAGNFSKLQPRKSVARKGQGTTGKFSVTQANSLSTTGFTALGPAPERMTGCTGCFDYTSTNGRVNAIVVDPTTTTNGSIVAYAGTVGGGVWKTSNCC